MNPTNFYKKTFQAIIDNFGAFDINNDGALSNKELLADNKDTKKVKEKLNKEFKGQADKFIKEIAGSNQEIRYLKPDGKTLSRDYYGSTKEDLNAALGFMGSEKTFEDLKEELLKVGPGYDASNAEGTSASGPKDSSTSTAAGNEDNSLKEPAKFKDEDFKNIGKTVEEISTKEDKNKNEYFKILEAIKSSFQSIDKDKDEFLSNAELFDQIEEIKAKTGIKDEKLIKEIIQNNQEFKFLFIDPGKTQIDAYNGMSTNDLDVAIQYLKDPNNSFSALSEKALTLEPGNSGDNRLKQISEGTSASKASSNKDDRQLTPGERKDLLAFLEEGLANKEVQKAGITQEKFAGENSPLVFLGSDKLTEYEKTVLNKLKESIESDPVLKNIVKELNATKTQVAFLGIEQSGGDGFASNSLLSSELAMIKIYKEALDPQKVSFVTVARNELNEALERTKYSSKIDEIGIEKYNNLSNTFDIEFAKTQSPAGGGDEFVEKILKTSKEQLTPGQTKVAKELLNQRFERYTKTTSENRLF